MGSYAYLYIDDLEIGWMKNHPGYWGHLFTKKDRKTALYKYADNETVRRRAYVRKLGDLRKVLKLSGRGSDGEFIYRFHNKKYEDLPEDVSKVLCERFKKIRVSDIIEDEEFWRKRGIRSRHYFNDEVILQISDKYKINPFDQLYYDSLLSLLLLNKENENSLVTWQYMDVVDGGWCTEEEVAGLVGKAEPRFLIITEGSSDTFVLSRALEILEPLLAPYFKFIDMTENYPFTGTGNLFRFCQGLSKIGIENRILIIFDNDTEGKNRYKETMGLKLPKNMKAVVLPDLKEAKKFSTIGPNGQFRADVNGKAVSIEMFLDLNKPGSGKPRIRWTSFDQFSGNYQGHLENKDAYVRYFKSIRPNEPGYNFRKLKSLVEWLTDQCATIEKEPSAQ